jgi:hypothetical protein
MEPEWLVTLVAVVAERVVFEVPPMTYCSILLDNLSPRGSLRVRVKSCLTGDRRRGRLFEIWETNADAKASLDI